MIKINYLLNSNILKDIEETYQVDKREKTIEELVYSTTETYIRTIIHYFINNTTKAQERELYQHIGSNELMDTIINIETTQIELDIESADVNILNNICANCSISCNYLISFILSLYSAEKKGESEFQTKIFFK